MSFWGCLADVVLVVHFAFVVFIVGGLALVWVGGFAGWRFVRNFKFRVTHLAAMGFVLLETLVGTICPLTEWENALRVRGGEGAPYVRSFIETWLGRLLYYEFSPGVFLGLYATVFALVLLGWWKVRPTRSPRSR